MMLNIFLIFYLISACYSFESLGSENHNTNSKLHTQSHQQENIDLKAFCKQFRCIMPIDRYSYPEECLLSVYQIGISPADRSNFVEFSKPLLSRLTIYDRSYSLNKLISIYNSLSDLYERIEFNIFCEYIFSELPSKCRFASLNFIFLLYERHLMLEKEDKLNFIYFIVQELRNLEADQKSFYLRKDLIMLYHNRSYIK